MTEEITFYSNDQGIRVTSARLIIGDSVYAMTNITSVKRAVTKPKRTGPLFSIGIGIVFMLGTLASGDTGGVVFGMILIALGIIWWLLQKPTYHLRVASASGEADALSNKDEKQIMPVVQAINEAMIHRG